MKIVAEFKEYIGENSYQITRKVFDTPYYEYMVMSNGMEIITIYKDIYDIQGVEIPLTGSRKDADIVVEEDDGRVVERYLTESFLEKR